MTSLVLIWLQRLLATFSANTQMILASSSQRRMLTPEPQDLFNIETWSRENNLTLDTTKSVEIVFTDKYRNAGLNRRQSSPVLTE